MGAAARQFVEQTYDWEAVLAPLDEILAACVEANV